MEVFGVNDAVPVGSDVRRKFRHLRVAFPRCFPYPCYFSFPDFVPGSVQRTASM